MCGFSGIFSCTGGLSDSIGVIEDASGLLSHRGPDSTKNFIDCHCQVVFHRLAIVDLRTASDQPYKKGLNPVILFFNGEIYNHNALRKELELSGVQFETRSDTEVVYEAYINWGMKCFEKFLGMFAIGLYNLVDKSIILSRDPLGIKPMYFEQNKDEIVFASEIKFFHKLRNLTVNEDNIIEQLSYGDIYSSKTLYDNVNKILPGQCLIFKENKIKTYKYFDLQKSFSGENRIMNRDFIHDTLRDVTFDHMNCDVNYGLQLSGGLDSSLLCAIAAELSNKALETFSINFDIKEVDESVYQQYVSEQTGFQHHAIAFTSEDFFDVEKLELAIWYNDGPLHHPNLLASNKLNSYASQRGIKVLLSGDGADEVFGGYQWNISSSKNYQKCIEESEFVSSAELTDLFNSNLRPVEFSYLATDLDSIEDVTRTTSYVAQRYYLQKWLQRQDRSGMMHSVEIRVPFLDLRLINYVNASSNEQLTRGGEIPKAFLKDIALDYFDEAFVYRKKIGFPLPLEDWFRIPENPYINILKSLTFTQNYISQSRVDDLISTHSKGVNKGRMLWTILNFELWLKILHKSNNQKHLI